MIIKKNQSEIEPYLQDASNFCGSAECVYIPESEEEISDLLIMLYSKGTPFTLSGARTSLTGASIPNEGVIISMEKFDKLIDIDESNKTATVMPNYTSAQLEYELKRYGLFYPPNPTEKNSSFGGNISTNASGSRTFKYGATRNWVEALEILLPQGDYIFIKRNAHFADGFNLDFSTNKRTYKLLLPDLNLPQVKNVAGIFCKKDMDLIDLFIGSEGTLGIVTKIQLKLIETPEKLLALLIFFDNEFKMLNFVDYVRQKSKTNFNVAFHSINDISARSIEFFDKFSLDLLNSKFKDIPLSAISAIWIEQEYSSENEDSIMNSWYSIINKYTSLFDYTWVALSETEHQKLRDFRHELPLKVNELLSRNRIRKIGSDIAVPDNHLHRFYFFLKNELEATKLPYMNWGHIGNNHFHANLLPQNDIQYQRGLIFLNKCLTKAIELKGTVSGEHGIGKIKKQHLKMMLGEKAIEDMKIMKKVLDPKLLLNRGNLFD